jgi:hypothetical protein
MQLRERDGIVVMQLISVADKELGLLDKFNRDGVLKISLVKRGDGLMRLLPPHHLDVRIARFVRGYIAVRLSLAAKYVLKIPHPVFGDAVLHRIGVLIKGVLVDVVEVGDMEELVAKRVADEASDLNAVALAPGWKLFFLILNLPEEDYKFGGTRDQDFICIQL